MKFDPPRFKISTLLFVTMLVACVVGSIVAFGDFAVFVGLVASFVGTSIGYLVGPRWIPKTWTRISAVLLIALATLFASYGPATYLFAKWTLTNKPRGSAYHVYQAIYRPVSRCLLTSPEPVRSALVSYLSWWMPAEVTFRDWGYGVGWTYPHPPNPSLKATYTLLSFPRRDG